MPKTSHVALGAAAGFVAMAAVILTGWALDAPLTVVNDVVSIALTMAAIGFAAAAARSLDGRRRLAWVALTVGLVGWGFGKWYGRTTNCVCIMSRSRRS